MTSIEYYFSIINIILLIIMFIKSYINNYIYIKKTNENNKIQKEVMELKKEIINEEIFYKRIISNLSEYLQLINKNKKIFNTFDVPLPTLIKKEEKQTLWKLPNIFNKIEKSIPKKNEEIKDIKKPIVNTSSQISIIHNKDCNGPKKNEEIKDVKKPIVNTSSQVTIIHNKDCIGSKKKKC